MQVDSTNLTVLGLLFLACMGVLTWSLPRRLALIPLLITTCYMPLGQMFVVAGLHFQVFRILLLVGVCRVLTRGEAAGLELTRQDKIFFYWAAATLLIGTLTQPSLDRFINRSGDVYTALGSYFLFRCWIRTLDDVRAALRFLGWMILPLAISMVAEKFTRRNIFAIFGGVPPWTEIRDGTLRCQGAFRHPILAGTYGATLFPLFVGLWFQRGRFKVPAIAGGCGAIIVTGTAGSSGALLAFVVAVIGFMLWPLRRQMRVFRWSIVLTIVLLALVMNAPVWFLIGRASEIVGGTGWHRSYLIDQAVRHFNEWWLVGTARTAHWAPAGQVLPADPNNMDITNHYVAEAIGGGLIKLGLFVALIVQGYKIVGRWNQFRNLSFSTRIFAWSLGVSLTAHCVSFISISYFDQLIVMWFWLLAIFSMSATRFAYQAESRTGGETRGAVRPKKLQPVSVGF